MKKVFLLTCLLFTACSHVITRQQVAENLVKNYLNQTLSNQGSYRVQGFDFLTSVYQVVKPGFTKRDTLEVFTKDAGDKSAPDSTVVAYKITAGYVIKANDGQKQNLNTIFWLDNKLTKVNRQEKLLPPNNAR